MVDKKEVAEVKKEVASIEFVCKKILQAYRIRLKALKRRHDILESVEHKFENISNYKKGAKGLFAGLEANLQKEQKVLEIIKNEEGELGDLLAYALNLLKFYKEGLKKDITSSSENVGINPRDFWPFLNNMIAFLKQMEKDLSKIETRMQLEKAFLKFQDKAHFISFVQAWKAELRLNEKMVRHLERFLRINKKTITKGRLKASAILGATSFLGPISMVLAKWEGASDEVVIGMAATSISVILVWFVLNLKAEMREELVEVAKDRKIIADLKRAGLVKPWWKRLTGSI